jgi:hypothetical protein
LGNNPRARVKYGIIPPESGRIEVLNSRNLLGEVDDFSITIDSSLFVFATVMSKMSLHQPRFGTIWIHFENSIDENLGDLPPFFGDCSRCV